LQSLHSFYQKRYLPPFWAMGYHQSRWGYKDIAALKDVISNFENYDLPLDTLWSDLDYTINSEMFTIDETRFPL
jgi:alpha-glucosidase (family GH31 glycosyl hydrolase)